MHKSLAVIELLLNWVSKENQTQEKSFESNWKKEASTPRVIRVKNIL